MKHLLAQKRGLVLLLCLMLSFSCGGKVTSRSNPTKFKFTINGVVIKDMELGMDIAYFAILRDGNPFGGAVVKVGNDTLANQGNGNYYLVGFPLFSFGQNVAINISSASDNFSLAASVVIPGSFFIDELPANDQLNVGGHGVPVEWGASAGAGGYFLSMTGPAGSVGHAVLDQDNNRAETIPPDAFRTSPGDLVEGPYDVYVIAYYKSFLYYTGIAFELPVGLPTDNLDGANGTIGAGVIAPLVKIEVTSG
jgi:hypothetical protein